MDFFFFFNWLDFKKFGATWIKKKKKRQGPHTHKNWGFENKNDFWKLQYT